MINNKVDFLETSKSCVFSITVNFNLDNPKLLMLFDNSSFYIFNMIFAYNIDLKELFSSLSYSFYFIYFLI